MGLSANILYLHCEITISYKYVGYTMRPVVAAENYDVVSFARAMNDDFAPRVKKLFDPERKAAVEAQKTGNYYEFISFIVLKFTY